LCGVGVGLVVGNKLALFREHQRLEHNKELVRIMEDKVFSEKDVEAAMNVAREIHTSDFLVHDWTGDHKGMDALAEGLRYTQADFLDWKESVDRCRRRLRCSASLTESWLSNGRSTRAGMRARAVRSRSLERVGVWRNQETVTPR